MKNPLYTKGFSLFSSQLKTYLDNMAVSVIKYFKFEKI